jgi:hypothetical protein
MAAQATQKRANKQVKSRPKRVFFRYPLLIFLLLCAGAFLVAATLNVGADDILVTAEVHGQPVTQPAIITSPASGSHFSSIPITVTGTCPTNAAYVEIFRNNLMSGSALCSSNSFQLQIDLFPGQNTLVAHVFNVTDDEGPVSTPVTVFYDVPAPNTHPGTVVSKHPLVLKTAFIYKGYYVDQEVQWPIEISGGTKPYALNVDWGDGNNDVISRGSEGTFNIKHIYSKPGDNNGSYEVKVKASDSADQTAFLQFFVIVNARQTATAGNIFNKPTPSLGNKNWLWVAWPAYGVVVLMTVSYLLGEKEELIILSKKGLLKR